MHHHLQRLLLTSRMFSCVGCAPHVLLKPIKNDEYRDIKVKDYQTIFITPYQKLLNTDLCSVYITLNDTSKPTSPEHRSHSQGNTAPNIAYINYSSIFLHFTDWVP